MLWTAAAQAATMAVLAGLYNIEQTGNSAAQAVSVLCLFLFNTWFSIGWLGMTWCVLICTYRWSDGQAVPCRSYAFEDPGSGKCPLNRFELAFQLLRSVINVRLACRAQTPVVMATGPMFANIGLGTYALFAALNGAVIFPVVYLFFPETKKYSLEDVSPDTRIII